MKKRKIFEQQIIDCETGEVKKISITSMVQGETFGMYRTTTGLEWISLFRGQELQMLMLLTHFENIKTNIVSLSPLIREEIRNILKIKPAAFSNIIKELSNKKCLIKLSHSDLLLNPIYFYKGSSSNLGNRIQEFNKILDIENNKNTESANN